MTLNVARRTVIVEYVPDDGWLAMTGDGAVELFAEPADVVAWIKRADAGTTRRGADVTATVVQWRNTPPGFVQPDPT